MGGRPRVPTKIEEEILIEYGHRCAVCGYPCPLERAHIIPWHQSKEHKAEDMICLCANCHERADKENWGEKTLREYKRRPMVKRRFEGTDSVPEATATITLTLEDIPGFDERLQRLLEIALAALLDISPDTVKTISVKRGSMKITIDLPAESAEKLLTAYEQNDPELRKFLVPFVLLDLRGETKRREEVPNSYLDSNNIGAEIYRLIELISEQNRLISEQNALNKKMLYRLGKENIFPYPDEGEDQIPVGRPSPTPLGIGYPALFLDAKKRKVCLKSADSDELGPQISGAEYYLFCHIIELLQPHYIDENDTDSTVSVDTHWAWGYVLWESWRKNPIKDPKIQYAPHCCSLEVAWRKYRS